MCLLWSGVEDERHGVEEERQNQTGLQDVKDTISFVCELPVSSSHSTMLSTSDRQHEA